MNSFSSLVSVEDGEYRCSLPWKDFFNFEKRKKFGGRRGWLSVKIEDGEKKFIWRNGKNSHSQTEPALCLYIQMSGNLSCYMEHYLSWWVKWGYGHGGSAELDNAEKFATWIITVLPDARREIF